MVVTIAGELAGVGSEFERCHYGADAGNRSLRVSRAKALRLDSVPAILLVGVGGAIGTLARALLGMIFADPSTSNGTATAFVMLLINVTGALLLGWLISSLENAENRDTLQEAEHVQTKIRERIRLFAGTGMLGGFTSYSALSLDTVTLLREGSIALATAYSLGTVILAGLGVALGAFVGSRQQLRRGEPR